MLAVLDLPKAYDSVPHQILQDMLDEHLPIERSTVFRPLLSPMILQTKNPKSNHIIKTLVSMPQGDRPSPLLFNLFMDGYIKITNTKNARRFVTLFGDHVLLFARSVSICSYSWYALWYRPTTSSYLGRFRNPVESNYQVSCSSEKRAYQTQKRKPTSVCQSDRGE